MELVACGNNSNAIAQQQVGVLDITNNTVYTRRTKNTNAVRQWILKETNQNNNKEKMHSEREKKTDSDGYAVDEYHIGATCCDDVFLSVIFSCAQNKEHL